LETVDGGLLEDVTITNLTMRDIVNAPIYIRLGARMRGPDDASIGKLRRVLISNVVIHNAPSEQGVLIAGIPDHPIEDLRLENIRIDYAGGGTEKQATSRPTDHVKDYPEPANHGPTPAYGFFIRHVKNLELSDIHLSYAKDDVRPPFVIESCAGVDIENVKAEHLSTVPVFVLRQIQNFRAQFVDGVADVAKPLIDEASINGSP
jgi:hypothetical protein